MRSFFINILELKKKFEQKGVNPHIYSFKDDYLHDCYCMLKDDIGWEVFSRVRSRKIEIRWFELESEACEYLEYLVFSDRINN